MIPPGDPAAHTRAAVELRDQGDAAGAEALIAETMLKFPAFLGAFMIWAHMAARQRDWFEAAARWTEIRAAFPAQTVGYIEGARAARETGDRPAADAIIEDALVRFPNDFGVWLVWGETAMRAQDWAEAERRWSALRMQFPNECLPLVERAIALRHAGDPRAAEAILLEAHERFPTADRPLHDLARLAEERGDWEAVVGFWRCYRRVAPPVWFAYTGEAQALRRLDRLDDAETVLLEARQVLPNEGPLVLDLARLAEDRRDWTAAIVHWADFRTLRPGDWIGYTAAASAARQIGHHDEAMALLREGVARLPDEPPPLHDLARLAEDRRDWPTAAEAWHRFSEKFPHTWFSFAGHAGALRQLGRTDEAEALLRSAVPLFPDELGPVMGLVDLLASAGRWSDAADVVGETLHARPGNAELLAMRADLAVKLDRRDVAVATWRDLPADTPDGFQRKLNFACDILRLDPAASHAPELLVFLVSEPDNGEVGWVPRSAMLLHAMVLDPQAPIPALTVFFNANPALFAGSLHRLIWIALLGLSPSEADLDETMARVVVPGRFGVASFLFSTYILGGRPVWGSAVLARLTDHMQSNLGLGLDAILSLAIASMHRPDAFWDGVTVLLDREADRGEPEDTPASARRILSRFLANVSGAARFAAAPPAIAQTDRRLKIALCISGQLRGFRDAFPTWRPTGLFQHDTHLFVHTWRDVGLNWLRSFGFFQFTHPALFAALARPDGRAVLAEHFPSLAAAAEGGMAAAAHAEPAMLRDFYDTPFVGLEDDAQPPFAGRPNDWKMLYKIQQAHDLAVSSGENFDLYVRIRPDIGLEFGEEIDCHRLAWESARDRRLFMDSPVQFTAPDGKLKAGDQVAIGTLEPMRVYANTVDFDPAGAALLGAPPAPKAHETLGNALFAQGVLSSSIQGMRRKILLNPAVLTPGQVTTLAEADAAAAPDTDFARQLLAACRRATERT